MALKSDGCAFGNVDVVGLAIHVTPLGYHSGILYLDGSEARILDLAFHFKLRDEPAEGPFRWTQISLDRINKTVLAALVARIAHKTPYIPYGFNSDAVSFDFETGDLLTPPVGRGLTCATFILAVFDAYGYSILDRDYWPIRAEDAEWHATILSMLEEHADEGHVNAVRADRNAPRFRPEEVVGAATSEIWPVPFATALELAEQIRADLAA